jgi:group I intron endonuclease
MRCIYRIDVGDRYYIGSAKNLKTRMNSHFNKLKCGNHSNIILQNLYNKYGKESFTFQILENVGEDVDLFQIEQRYLDIHIQNDNCVNISPIAGGGKVYTPTLETIQKGLETKKRTGRWGTNYGDTSAAILANTGSKRSKEFCEKQSNLMKSIYKNDKERLEEFKKASDRGRKNRWEKYDKPFILVKGGIEYGPYKTQKDAYKSKILSLNSTRSAINIGLLLLSSNGIF